MLSKFLKFLFIGLALMITNSSFAQTQDRTEKKSNPEHNEFLKKDLNLNDEEILLFIDYFNEYTKDLKAARLDQSLDRSAKKSKMADAKVKYYDNLKSFLTEKQFSKYLNAFDGSSKATGHN